jgi:predicted SprT family Zn-dependent metalloprotease
MDVREAKKMALTLMDNYGLLQNGWKFKWARPKRTIAEETVGANRSYKTGFLAGLCVTAPIKEIRVVKKYARLNTFWDVRGVILHEIAHVYATGRGDDGHGEIWQEFAIKLGVPSTPYTPDTSIRAEIARHRYSLTCPECLWSDDKIYRRPRRSYFCPNDGAELALIDRGIDG